jgi:hypothetical protein
VIAALARNDLFLVWPAENIVHVPDELDLGLIGIGAGKAVIDPAHVIRRVFDDLGGKLDRGFGAMAGIGVVIGELHRLTVNGVCHLLSTITDIDAVKPGKAVEQNSPVPVLDKHAVAAFDDAGGRQPLGMGFLVGRRMEKKCARSSASRSSVFRNIAVLPLLPSF